MLTVKMKKLMNKLIGEEIVVAQLMQEGTMDFDSFCEHVAGGTAVSPADVAMVMTLVEMKLPEFVALSSRIVCTPGGLTFRPKVSGSVSQSQLKARLKARAKNHPEMGYDIERPLVESDLTTNDLSASIAVDIPKKWLFRFRKYVDFRRAR